jgi:hypothetical protein
VGIFLRLAAEAESDIFFDGEVRKQGVILEDHADLPLFRGHALAGAADHLAVQADFAAGNFLEAGNAAQQSGLAAAGGAKQAGDLAFFQAKVDAIDNGGFSVALNDAI